MLATTASRTLTRAAPAASRLAARRSYATAGPRVDLGTGPATKPGAQAGPSPPAPKGTNNTVIIGSALVVAALGVYFFTQPSDAKQKLGAAEAKARKAGDQAGEALENLKAAGKEKLDDAKAEAERKAHQVQAKAEDLKKQGEAKLNEYKKGAEQQYNEAKKESQSLADKARADAASLLGKAEDKVNDAKKEVEPKKKGWLW